MLSEVSSMYIRHIIGYFGDLLDAQNFSTQVARIIPDGCFKRVTIEIQFVKEKLNGILETTMPLEDI